MLELFDRIMFSEIEVDFKTKASSDVCFSDVIAKITEQKFMRKLTLHIYCKSDLEFAIAHLHKLNVSDRIEIVCSVQKQTNYWIDYWHLKNPKTYRRIKNMPCVHFYVTK
uniref:Uncharacterized protein n=1 Tax=Euplotes harpa TaxID=151035 RepID=A0A7S3J151_9SPIT|mmetsp:Transcript_14003/g.16220  ORF Transcript_14003/g.16220 Transcript_14003/m.16220 type:complete len:110 (+) Transcript_14003:515-844(+)